ncbi:major facilitator superfamily domain-containing protein [Mycena polygramma]|nr:major facilitator superfamily domain-containing protein [Mycena polygramma]
METSPQTASKSQLTLALPAFPEGGREAWATVAGAFLIQFCGFGYTSSFGAYQDFYTRDYLTESSTSAISWIGSVNALIIWSGGLVAGRLYDRGHFHLLLCGGCLLQCFSLFMLSLCQREQLYQIFLAQGVGLGLGAGIVYIPSVAVISHYFQKRRALAMTIVASGSSLGSVVHPIMLNNLFCSLGFANGVRASAGLVSGLLIIACLLMRPRLPPPDTHPPFWKSLQRFARDLPYVFAVLAMATYTMGFYFPLFYFQLEATTHGINQTLSFYSLVIMNGSSFVGRLSPGFFVHRFGVINMIAVATGVGSVLLLCMIALKSIASVVVLGVLYGYSAGLFVTLMAPLVAVLTDNMGELGLRMGVGFAVVGLGSLVGPPINGALLTADFKWWQPALFSGIMGFTGFALFVATLIAVRRREKAAAFVLEKTDNC